MMNYIIRRLLIAIPVLFGITLLNFTIIHLAPGSPVDMYLDPNIPPEALEERREQLGLNDPIWQQYLKWIGQILQGNLGYSATNFESVTALIGERIGPTLTLMGTALLAGILIALPLGIISALRQNSVLDYIATGGAFLGISVPQFFLGLAAIYIFSLELNLLPSGGMKSLGGDGGLADRLKHLILPASVLAASIAGQLVRYVRASVLEILGQDYLRTARAKGLSEWIVTMKHALRNALIPIITVIGLQIPILFGGAVILEEVFQWPGIGQLAIDSIMTRDYPTLMGLNLISAIVVLMANLLTDIAYSFADPRIRFK
jgi:peptide/nickel transport system permease protein